MFCVKIVDLNRFRDDSLNLEESAEDGWFSVIGGASFRSLKTFGRIAVIPLRSML